MNINRRKQLSRLINDLTPEISKRKIFLNFQQSFHFSTNVLIIEQRNKNFLEYFRNSYTFTSELLKRRKKSKCKKNSFDQNVEKRKESFDAMEESKFAESRAQASFSMALQLYRIIPGLPLSLR